jgi:hypothetical protein
VTASSPADLAIVYRSLARRRREAHSSGESARATGKVGNGAPGTASGRIDAVLLTAAGLLGCVPDPTAVAEAIEQVRPKDWDESVLDALRAGALELGHALRELAAGG